MNIWRIIHAIFWFHIRIILQVIGPQFGTREMEISSTDGSHVEISRDQPGLNRVALHRDYSTVSYKRFTYMG